MAKVLFVKANDRPAEQAVSVKLYDAFLSAYREGHPEDSISEIDLFREELPYYGNTTMSGIYKLANGSRRRRNASRRISPTATSIDSWLRISWRLPFRSGTSPCRLRS